MSASNPDTVDLGATKTLFVDFKNAAGQAANPGTVTLRVTDPAGGLISETIAPTVTTGRYEHGYVTALPGRHFVTWIGTAPVPAVVQHEFHVLRRQSAGGVAAP